MLSFMYLHTGNCHVTVLLCTYILAHCHVTVMLTVMLTVLIHLSTPNTLLRKCTNYAHTHTCTRTRTSLRDMHLYSTHSCRTCTCVGLARTIHIRCMYGIFGREITKYTVIYGVYIYGSGQPYTCAARTHGHEHTHMQRQSF